MEDSSGDRSRCRQGQGESAAEKTASFFFCKWYDRAPKRTPAACAPFPFTSRTDPAEALTPEALVAVDGDEKYSEVKGNDESP